MVIDSVNTTNKPSRSVNTKLESAGLNMDGNKITGLTKEAVTPKAPIYDYNIHKPGDRVRVWKGRWVETMVPKSGEYPV